MKVKTTFSRTRHSFKEKSEQVRVALSAVTESESVDFVLGAAPSGLEALRRWVRR